VLSRLIVSRCEDWKRLVHLVTVVVKGLRERGLHELEVHPDLYLLNRWYISNSVERNWGVYTYFLCYFFGVALVVLFPAPLSWV
jgi:hypothetical protein